MRHPAAEASILYRATVAHTRLRPVRHAFRYRLFLLLLDLDDLPNLSRRLWFFSTGRFNLVGFRDSDHGDRRPGGLRDWVEARLAEAGLPISGGRIRLLCMPRVLGCAFNPISTYFCDDTEGNPHAVIYEVRNTFGERHVYAAAADTADSATPSCHAAEKRFHVSPFMPMRMTYRFRLLQPAQRLLLSIRGAGEQGALIVTHLRGQAHPLTDAGLIAALVRLPLLGFAVLGAIHWEALLLALKRVRFHRKPACALHGMTIASDRP